MIAGHRWEYQPDYRGYKCVPLGGVESYQWCVGCGCIITDHELVSLMAPSDDLMLDTLAYGRGFSPIQSGTREEMFLRIRQAKQEVK